MIVVELKGKYMMDLVSNILNDRNVRESLIELKKDFKANDNIQLRKKLILLLEHEDPKVRKNAA